MPIWFQINRLRVRMPFWHITAVKIKCFFFLILSCHFTGLRSWQRHPCHKAVRLHAEFATAFFSCFRIKVCVWRHVSWWGLTFAWACLLVTALRNLNCTGVYHDAWSHVCRFERLSSLKFNFDRKRLEFAPCAQTSFRSLLILAKNILPSLFVKPPRSQLTRRPRSIALPVASCKFSTRCRMCTGNARVSWGMYCTECRTRNLYCLCYLQTIFTDLNLRNYRNAKTLQKHCKMRFKHYETK